MLYTKWNPFQLGFELVLVPLKEIKTYVHVLRQPSEVLVLPLKNASVKEDISPQTARVKGTRDLVSW